VGDAVGTWRQLSQAITQNTGSLITKIKRAASQPALASGGGLGVSLAEAADALLAQGSRAAGLPRVTPRVQSVSSGGSGGVDLLGRGLNLPPRKDMKGE
jgi:hypothetical protein